MSLISKERFDVLIDGFTKVEPFLVVGDIGIDKYTYGDVHRISPEAPVPILEVKEEWFKLGLAANVSDNLIGLGVNSTLCGVIGDDGNGNLLEEQLEERNLKTWGIVRDASRPTILKERIVTNTQQICRVDYESKAFLNDQSQKKLERRIDEFHDNHSALIIEDYGKGLFNEALLQYIIKTFKEAGKIVAVDPSRRTPPLWYKGTTLLKPNRAEAETMVQALGYKETELGKMVEILVDKLALEQLIITLSGDGMALFNSKTDSEATIIPTVANEVFDVSGAGDTAISTICLSLASGATLEEAAWVGNCAAGVVVGKKGTARVSIDELRAFYGRLASDLQ